MFGKFPKKILGVILGLAVVAASVATAIPAMASGTWAMTLSGPSQVSSTTATSFDITINANISGQARNWQANLNYNGSQVTCTGVTEGTFLSAYATGHAPGIADALVTPPTISTATGSTSSGPFSYYLQGTGTNNTATGGPTGTGTLAVVHFTSVAGFNGSATISLSSDAEYGDQLSIDQPITNTDKSITVTIGNLPQPDLTPINVTTSGVTGNLSNYTVSFNVQNLGNLASPVATTANIYVDGSTTAATTVNVPVVAANSTSDLLTSSPITISGISDSVVVQIVPVSGETNTSNNTSTPITYVYQAPPTGNLVTVDGSIGLAFSFTPPSAVQFGTMHIGNNQVQDTHMNVTGNESWQITVQGLAPDPTMTTGYDGRMTKYGIVTPAPTASYPSNPYVRLTNPLQIGANTPIVGSSVSDGAVSLDGTIQNLGGGTPATQSGAAGLTMTTTFTQNVTSSDAYLATGFDYHIVVNFACTATGGI